MRCPACLLLWLLLAAGTAAAAEQKTPAGDLQAIATKFVDRLAAGDFATAVKSFDPTMTAALPPDKLAEVWKSLNAQAGRGPVRGIVLVPGSGPLDRDETIGPTRPFRDLASGLASRGVAVLRYDKRTLVHARRLAAKRDTLTLHDETVADAVEAVRLLRRSRGVDGGRVFVLGHSLGGVALPRIAALEPGIAGFVMLATPSRPLQDVYREQMAYLFGLDGVVTEEERARLESSTTWCTG